MLCKDLHVIDWRLSCIRIMTIVAFKFVMESQRGHQDKDLISCPIPKKSWKEWLVKGLKNKLSWLETGMTIHGYNIPYAQPQILGFEDMSTFENKGWFYKQF
jgi:hypothetical protein